MSVLDANTVRLSWEPVTVLEWEVAHYTISYTAYHTHLTKSVQHSSTVVPHTRTTEVFLITHTDPKFEHWFTVSVSIQVQGEEFQSEPSEIIFQFGEENPFLIICLISRFGLDSALCICVSFHTYKNYFLYSTYMSCQCRKVRCWRLLGKLKGAHTLLTPPPSLDALPG